MFLHLGNNYMVPTNKVIAILDLETAGNSPVSRSLLNKIIKKGKVLNVSEPGKEKSFVICDAENYFSPISSSTLLKRSMNQSDFESV